MFRRNVDRAGIPGQTQWRWYRLNGPLLSPLSKQVSETHSFAIHLAVVAFSSSSSSSASPFPLRVGVKEKVRANDERAAACTRKHVISVPAYNRIAERSYS